MKPSDANKALKLAERILHKRYLVSILEESGWYEITVKEFARELRKAYKHGLRDGRAVR